MDEKFCFCLYVYATENSSCKLQIVSLQCPHLSRSPEYLSTATSLGRGGREEGLGCPADAAGAGLLWEDGGDFRELVTLLVLSTGWKELPSFISTRGPLSSAENTVKKMNSKLDFH